MLDDLVYVVAWLHDLDHAVVVEQTFAEWTSDQRESDPASLTCERKVLDVHVDYERRGSINDVDGQFEPCDAVRGVQTYAEEGAVDSFNDADQVVGRDLLVGLQTDLDSSRNSVLRCVVNVKGALPQR
jgi:hypothetical protein